MMLWSLFKQAVYAAQDERARAARQARDLGRIAQALEDIVDDKRAAQRELEEAQGGFPMPSPKGK
ncbi:MAG: hypothetical protein ACHQC8_07105 [Solirubrobacterales bacterium]